MTVRECLEFAARLKLTGTEEQKMNRVDHLLKSLKLLKCQHTRIGGPLVKGVSGGERKRTSVGVELITDPSLIFLDEPTTGLDSFTATSVMEMLGDMARNENRTVISTIHQPNSDTFEQFDYLALLAKGKIIYFNKASKSVEYFSGIGFVCPEMSNPCDYFMSMMSIESIELDLEEEGATVYDSDPKNIKDEYEKLINFFDAKYMLSDLRCKPDVIDTRCLPLDGSEALVNVKVSFCYQWKLLAQRNFRNIMRLP
jgi:ABC-type multidrug transport system ATPase subunit